jgi:hypothetical protein
MVNASSEEKPSEVWTAGRESKERSPSLANVFWALVALLANKRMLTESEAAQFREMLSRD